MGGRRENLRQSLIRDVVKFPSFDGIIGREMLSYLWVLNVIGDRLGESDHPRVRVVLRASDGQSERLTVPRQRGFLDLR